jgi:hypothetical protein
MAACTVLLSHTHVKGQQWWVVACHQLIVPKPRCRTSLKKRVVLKYSRYSTLKTTLRAVHVMAKEAALGCVGTAACAWGAAYKCKHQCWCRAVTAEAVDWKLETAQHTCQVAGSRHAQHKATLLGRFNPALSLKMA